VRKELHTFIGAFDGGLTGTPGGALLAVFVFGGIVPFLIGLVVVVPGASVLRRAFDWRRDGTPVTASGPDYYLPCSVWKPAN
jgi:hypothetical protein